jgi:hypothetical protein
VIAAALEEVHEVLLLRRDTGAPTQATNLVAGPK